MKVLERHRSVRRQLIPERKTQRNSSLYTKQTSNNIYKAVTCTGPNFRQTELYLYIARQARRADVCRPLILDVRWVEGPSTGLAVFVAWPDGFWYRSISHNGLHVLLIAVWRFPKSDIRKKSFIKCFHSRSETHVSIFTSERSNTTKPRVFLELLRADQISCRYFKQYRLARQCNVS